MNIEVAFRHDYGKFRLDVAFGAQSHGITALFGPSGAGKTTVLNAVAGLLRPDEGRISVDGRVLFDRAAGIWLPAGERRIGYVFQDARLFPHMSVGANLRFGWRRARTRVPEEEVARVIEMLRLTALLDRKPANLSGGERGRVALGRALLASPDVLLLDEPLAALDAERKNEILPYLERVRDEGRVPMIYVSHSLDEISRLANEIVVLKDGKIAAAGSVFDVLTDLRLPDFAGGSPYGAVLETTIARHTEGLTVLSFPGGELIVSRLAQAAGTQLRTHVRAEDIMLACEAPRLISANNVLPATISALRMTPSSHVDVRLLCGPSAFVARITRSSCDRLSLREGMEVFAIVKSVTVVPQIDPPAAVA
jgi:molybdate transport system ATP-binding protein